MSDIDDGPAICINERHGQDHGVAFFDADPFQSEIYGDNTPVWMCDDCRAQSAEAI